MFGRFEHIVKDLIGEKSGQLHETIAIHRIFTYTICLHWFPFWLSGQVQDGTRPMLIWYRFPVEPAISINSSGTSSVPPGVRSMTNILDCESVNGYRRNGNIANLPLRGCSFEFGQVC